MKQTAVQWLQDKYDNCPESFLTEDDFEKAKEMEKQQIIDAYRVGKVEATFSPEKLTTGEQFYNETFKKD